MMLKQIKIYYDFSKKSSYFPSTLFLGNDAVQGRRNEVVQGKPTDFFSLERLKAQFISNSEKFL